jgi:hypothetical protein
VHAAGDGVCVPEARVAVACAGRIRLRQFYRWRVFTESGENVASGRVQEHSTPGIEQETAQHPTFDLRVGVWSAGVGNDAVCAEHPGAPVIFGANVKVGIHVAVEIDAACVEACAKRQSIGVDRGDDVQAHGRRDVVRIGAKMVGEHGGQDVGVGFWGAVGVADNHQFHRSVADAQRGDRAPLGGETNREVLHGRLA